MALIRRIVSDIGYSSHYATHREGLNFGQQQKSRLWVLMNTPMKGKRGDVAVLGPRHKENDNVSSLNISQSVCGCFDHAADA